MFLLVYLPSAAQIGQEHACAKIHEIANTTTLVVLDEDSLYNSLIHYAVDSFWTLTPVKYIPRDDLPLYEGDKGYSMLVRNNSIRVVHRAGRRTSSIKMNDLGLYLCDQGALENYLTRDALVAVPFRNLMDTEAYAHKLIGLVQSMQAYAAFLKEQNISPNKFEKALKTYKTRYLKELMYRKLLICEDDLPEKLRDLKKLKKVYKFEVEIVDKARMADAIKRQDMEVAFFHIHPRQREYYIMDARGGRLMYAAKVIDYGELKLKDFAALFNTIIEP
ncbi:MAG: hypothetical protein D6730_13120 [Bacteroidetes bacterium]|nr:MAG: hypothetical protein D6730_13120 [Bacteroidota bacterium]